MLCQRNWNVQLNAHRSAHAYAYSFVYFHHSGLKAFPTLSLGSYWKKWIRKLKNMREKSRCVKNRVFAEKVVPRWLGTKTLTAIVHWIVDLRESGGKIVRKWWGISNFLCSAHSAYFCWRDKKINLHLLRPFYPTVASTFWLLVLWGWEEVEAAALQGRWHFRKLGTLSIELPFLHAECAQFSWPSQTSLTVTYV